MVAASVYLLILDLYAMIVAFVLLGMGGYKHLRRGKSGRLYLSYLVLILVQAVCDLLTQDLLYGGIESESERVKIFVFHSLSYVIRALLSVNFLTFLFSFFHKNYLLRNKWFISLMSVPLAFSTVVVIVNAFNHFMFDVTAEDGIVSSYWSAVYILSGLVDLIPGCLFLLKASKSVPIEKWVTLVCCYGMELLLTLVLVFYPFFSLEAAVSTVEGILILCLVLHPEELIDQDSGLQNELAFNEEMSKVYYSKQFVQVCFVKMYNLEVYRTYVGEEEYIRELNRIEVYLQKILGTDLKLRSSEIYFEAPDLFCIISDNTKLKAGEVFPPILSHLKLEEENDGKDYGVREFAACLINVPKDASDLKELLTMAKVFPNFVGDVPYVEGRTLSLSKDFYVYCHIREILISALQNDLFRMVYQPIYHVKEGRFASAEALLRLQDPTYGNIPPSLFIGEAEKRGLMRAIGQVVLEKVYRFISTHDLTKLGISFIEINLSVQQCLDSHLCEIVDSLAKKYDVSSKNVNFEITESLFASRASVMNENLRHLAEEGYTFSLDDYGTGYSNLERICELPLSLIKFDKSLVDASDNKKGKSILKGGISMMKKMNFSVIVEGVETEQKKDDVIAIGADRIQGFYYSRPLEEDAYVSFMEKQKEKEAE